MLTIDYSQITKDVTDYGFDQLSDRLTTQEIEDNIILPEQVGRDYDEQVFTVFGTVVTGMLTSALQEKIRDIEGEVNRGERSDISGAAISDIRRGVDASTEGALIEINLSHVPEEVVGFAFDQFPDICTIERIHKEISTLQAHDQFDTDYENQTLSMNDTVPSSILRGALYEKIDDIANEVQRGDRQDYTDKDIENMRRDVRRAFTTEEQLAA